MRKLLDTLWGGHPSDFVLDSPYQLPRQGSDRSARENCAGLKSDP